MWPSPRFNPTRVGDTAFAARGGFPARGSSPRVWGIPADKLDVGPDQRFIPTRVGNTPDCTMHRIGSVRFIPTRVGKTIGRYLTPRRLSGPPPRVWGKLKAGLAAAAAGRSTPTRVGKTLALALYLGYKERSTPTRVGKTKHVNAWRAIHEVHPHACGENSFTGTVAVNPEGPPPRVWGKLRVTP